MTQRILTQAEQYPWRIATGSAADIPDPAQYGYGPSHWKYEHVKFTPTNSGWTDSGRHEWRIVPPSAPATVTLDDDYGRSHTVYYDPARTQVTRGEFGPEFSAQPVRVEDLSPPEGMLWRGMSDEEFQQARERGYFQSTGDYNIGEQQRGLTYFTTDPGQAGSYASEFSPWQWNPTFDRPGHVVGIPYRSEYPQQRVNSGEGESERGLSGQIPFSEVKHHYVGRPYAITPGDFGLSNENWQSRWEGSGRKNPKVRVQWEQGEVDP